MRSDPVGGAQLVRRGELSQCSRREIINAYDSGISYTDRLLVALIDQMKARSDRHDTVVMFPSDHGESLGERGLYLHGMPWAMASVRLVWVVELFNSAVEAVCDAVRAPTHPLLGRAKDMGSAAVLVSLLSVILTWGGV